MKPNSERENSESDNSAEKESNTTLFAALTGAAAAVPN